jgi:hypothetical protein
MLEAPRVVGAKEHRLRKGVRMGAMPRRMRVPVRLKRRPEPVAERDDPAARERRRSAVVAVRRGSTRGRLPLEEGRPHAARRG